MEVKILEEEKDSIKVEVNNITLAELLRVYLNQDSNVQFAAWRRDHPTENPHIFVRGKNPKKHFRDAASAATKDLEKFEKDFSKLR